MSEVRYRPTAAWVQDSHLQKFMERTGETDYAALLKRSQENTEWFWAEALADIDLHFSKTYTKLLAEGLPWPKWAVDGELSISENCIDRHLNELGDKPALIFEADSPGQSKTWSFRDLARESSYIAAQLIEAGAKPGDRAALLMPMSLEMVASFFGILRAGLTVIPIFSGYGKDAVAARIQDAEVKFVFAQEKTYRRGKEVPVLETLSETIKDCPSVQRTFILNREDFHRGHPAQDILPSVPMKSEQECLLLYTSGTTGKPKACVHTPFGVLATTGKEHRYAFDVRKQDRFFWYTDIGWMMGPWELIGALQFGASVVLYEGVPDYPDTNRLWEILEDHKVTHLGISPTAIRVLKKAPTDFLDQREFADLRVLGSTGEPWDDESWSWFFEKVGKSRCPIINISGGTEIMGCLLSPGPLSALKSSSLGAPALGINAQAWNEDGEALEHGLGHLVCLSPLPSMTKGFLNNPQRYLNTYFEKFGEKTWYHGDWALIDDEGFWYLKGRSDDTIKVAGKRVGPNEYESALMTDARVAEVAAVGIPHDVKGESVYCFVVLKDPANQTDEVRMALRNLAISAMGKALAPEKVLFVSSTPKTRSGKILRGIIRKIALNEAFDEGSVENPSSLEDIRKAS